MTAYRGQEQPKLIPCGGCGTFIDPSKATYALDGKLACPACVAAGQISEANRRGSEGTSFNNNNNNNWIRIVVVLALVLLRLLLRFG